MIQTIKFINFKCLRDTTLPLSQFTLIVGPNGSGKTTIFEAIALCQRLGDIGNFEEILTLGSQKTEGFEISFQLEGSSNFIGYRWKQGKYLGHVTQVKQEENTELRKILNGLEKFSLDAEQIAAPVTLTPNLRLHYTGACLAGVLDQLRDQYPERFESLNKELAKWFTEYDRILFETPSGGQRSLLLRTREGHYAIRARNISQGTLLALTIFTLAYSLQPYSMVFFEEPDRGIHPRLLPYVRDAMYRLSFPQDYGENRDPIQVIATTHSPFFLDLYKDHPEAVVIASKNGIDAHFKRLSDHPDLEELLRDTHLGEIWYTGILGGVP